MLSQLTTQKLTKILESVRSDKDEETNGDDSLEIRKYLMSQSTNQLKLKSGMH